MATRPWALSVSLQVTSCGSTRYSVVLGHSDPPRVKNWKVHPFSRRTRSLTPYASRKLRKLRGAPKTKLVLVLVSLLRSLQFYVVLVDATPPVPVLKTLQPPLLTTTAEERNPLLRVGATLTLPSPTKAPPTTCAPRLKLVPPPTLLEGPSLITILKQEAKEKLPSTPRISGYGPSEVMVATTPSRPKVDKSLPTFLQGVELKTFPPLHRLWNPTTIVSALPLDRLQTPRTRIPSGGLTNDPSAVGPALPTFVVASLHRTVPTTFGLEVETALLKLKRTHPQATRHLPRLTKPSTLKRRKGSESKKKGRVPRPPRLYDPPDTSKVKKGHAPRRREPRTLTEKPGQGTTTRGNGLVLP